MRKRLLLFDIDGTLIDSGGAGVRALKDVVKERFGIVDDLHGVEIAGKTDTGIVHQILRKKNMPVTSEATAAFLDHYVDFLARELPRREGRMNQQQPRGAEVEGVLGWVRALQRHRGTRDARGLFWIEGVRQFVQACDAGY